MIWPAWTTSFVWSLSNLVVLQNWEKKTGGLFRPREQITDLTFNTRNYPMSQTWGPPITWSVTPPSPMMVKKKVKIHKGPSTMWGFSGYAWILINCYSFGVGWVAKRGILNLTLWGEHLLFKTCEITTSCQKTSAESPGRSLIHVWNLAEILECSKHDT